MKNPFARSPFVATRGALFLLWLNNIIIDPRPAWIIRHRRALGYLLLAVGCVLVTVAVSVDARTRFVTFASLASFVALGTLIYWGVRRKFHGRRRHYPPTYDQP